MALTQDITGITYFLNCPVQRATAQFGINTSPTTIDLDLIPDPPTYDFNITGALPGSLNRFTMGSLDVIGFIQSWNKNFSANGGLVYNVKLSDPRLVLDTVPVVIDKFLTVPTGFNIISLLTYYGNTKAADLTEDGMTFRKIRDGIQNSADLNFYNNRFKIQFTGGFSDSKIPSWYRPNAGQSSLNSLISQVASDFNMDFYATVDPANYGTTGANVIIFNTIERNQTNLNSISGIINSWQSSGIVAQYSFGQELRSDPTASLVLGTNYTEWYSPVVANGKSTKTYWGRASDGSALFHFNTPAGGFYPSDTIREASGYGIVMLDNIGGSYGSIKLDHGSARITYEKITISKIANTGSSYPPQITRVVQTATSTGYYPTNNIMRAALFSKEAWEAVLYKENYTFASSVLSIYDSPFLVVSEFTNSTSLNIPLINASGVSSTYSKSRAGAANLVTVGTNLLARSEDSIKLSDVIYEATRRSAEEYYGRSWIVDLPTSAFLATGSYSTNALIPSIEYQVITDAWSASGQSIPSGIGNHSSLFYSTNDRLRSTNGNIKGFVSFQNYGNTSNTFFLLNNAVAGLDFNLDNLRKDDYTVDQGGNIVFPVGTQQYELAPDRAIVSCQYPLNGNLPIAGLKDGVPYVFPPDVVNFGHFLHCLGFDSNQIRRFRLLSHSDENKQYGLAMPRVNKFTSDGTSQGIFIPLEYKYQYFGPFTSSSGSRNGGVNVITDSSLSPSLYGSYANFSSAANDLARISVANATYIENGEFVLAGLPRYNITDGIGDNNIVGISIQYGRDGVTTTYSLKTFALPSTKVSKILSAGKSVPRFINNIGEQKEDIVIGDSSLDTFRNKLSSTFKGFAPYGSLMFNGPGYAGFNWLFSELTNDNS